MLETALELCNGCHACYSLCPKKAIKMVSNTEGFLFPQINNDLCIECGLCEKICPVLNPITKENELTAAYAIINNDEEIRLQSSSGGVFSVIAQDVIKQNGIVFGAKFDNDFNVVHGFTDSIEGLSDFRGSKYVQSAIGDSYKSCKNFLDEGRQVLFSGTPCQIAGLQSFLGKNYDNLLLVDIICHGVPSPLLWTEYKKTLEKKFASRIVKTAFRRKDYGWKQYSLAVTFGNASEYCNTLRQDSYLKLFLKDVCLRESCYNCKYKTEKRIADITIADFWGVQNEYPELDDDKGTSFVITHSDKGKFSIEKMVDCTIKAIPIENGVKYNPSYVRSVLKSRKRSSFFKELNMLAEGNISLDKLVKKYTVDGFCVKGYRFIRRCLGKIKRVIVK